MSGAQDIPLRMRERQSFGTSSIPLPPTPQCLLQKYSKSRIDEQAWETWRDRL
jgi:hypothetical protein